MIKLLKKDRLQFLLIFIVTNIFCAIFLLSPKSPKIDLISSLTSTNYITLILNNIYIFYMFKKAKKVMWLIIQNVLFLNKDLQNKMSYYKEAKKNYKPIYKTKCPIEI